MSMTNKGKRDLLQHEFIRTESLPTNYYVALVTDSGSPGDDTNLMSDLTEVPNGNGYTSGGIQLTPGATDFDTITEDDENDRGEIKIKDLTFLATGGAIPISGDPVHYAVLTDDNVTPASRKILDTWDLGTDIIIAENNSLVLQDLTIRLKKPAV